MISLRMNTDLLVGSNGRENSSPSASIGPRNSVGVLSDLESESRVRSRKANRCLSLKKLPFIGAWRKNRMNTDE